MKWAIRLPGARIPGIPKPHLASSPAATIRDIMETVPISRSAGVSPASASIPFDGALRDQYARMALVALVEYFARIRGEARYTSDITNQPSIALARSAGFVEYGSSLLMVTRPKNVQHDAAEHASQEGFARCN